eukprot:397690-Lingulodinium_polyedra.AAC.1
MIVVDDEPCTDAGSVGNRAGIDAESAGHCTGRTYAIDADCEGLIPAMPTYGGSLIHREKGGPLPFFDEQRA